MASRFHSRHWMRFTIRGAGRCAAIGSGRFGGKSVSRFACAAGSISTVAAWMSIIFDRCATIGLSGRIGTIFRCCARIAIGVRALGTQPTTGRHISRHTSQPLLLNFDQKVELIPESSRISTGTCLRSQHPRVAWQLKAGSLQEFPGQRDAKLAWQSNGHIRCG